MAQPAECGMPFGVVEDELSEATRSLQPSNVSQIGTTDYYYYYYYIIIIIIETDDLNWDCMQNANKL